MSSISMESVPDPSNNAPDTVPAVAEPAKTPSVASIPSTTKLDASVASPNPWAQDLSFSGSRTVQIPPFQSSTGSSAGSTTSLPPTSDNGPLLAFGPASTDPSFAKFPSSGGSAIDVKGVPSPAPSADTSTDSAANRASPLLNGAGTGKPANRPRSASRTSMNSSNVNVYNSPSTTAAAKGSFPMPRPFRALFDWTLHMVGRSQSPAQQAQLIEQSVNATIKVWSQWRQFKSFVNQGRIVETSIAVVIGDSFKDVVRSFVNDMLLPPFQRIMGGASFFSYWILRHGRTAGKLYTSVDEARGDGAVVLSIWNFADRLFNFFVVGLSAYYMLRAFKYFFHRYIEPENRDCPECFSSIPKKATRCAFCTTHVEAQSVFYPRY